MTASPDFSWGCRWNINYCKSWGKDVRRCCPETCGTGVFTEEDCNSFDGKGSCVYPNDAQCSGLIFKIYISMIRKMIYLFPLPVLPVSGSGVTDSDPASVLVAGNDELPYKFSVHEYLKKDDKYLILIKILE